MMAWIRSHWRHHEQADTEPGEGVECDPMCDALIESGRAKQRMEDHVKSRTRDVARTRLEQMQLRHRIKTGNIVEDSIFSPGVTHRREP